MLLTPPIEPPSLEEERKAAYLFCAEAIAEKLGGKNTILATGLEVIVLRIEKAMRAAAAVPALAVAVQTPISEQPKVAEPVAVLETTKVN